MRYEFDLENLEYVWGSNSRFGDKMPFESGYKLDIRGNNFENQCASFLLTNKGKCIYSKNPFYFEIYDDKIILEGKDIFLEEGSKSLKGAYLKAVEKVNLKPESMVEKEFFISPQFNTWIELIYNQNQEDVIKYAERIKEFGIDNAILMIDDNWQEDYGVWKFRSDKFPNPKEMTDTLHKMGFKVMLWTAPFISPDSEVFRKLEKEELLVKDSKTGDPAIIKWWNGYSAELDLSNPKAVDWYNSENKRLMDEFGIDGFKFDAGDCNYYNGDYKFFEKSENENYQTQCFAKLGAEYKYNEFRASFNCQQLPLVQRLCDKKHGWSDNGVDSLVADTVAQGLMGYPFVCSDMIGGGQYSCFLDGSADLDQELFVRYAQCAALMPMMQFSAAPWRVLSEENCRLCFEAVKIHKKFTDYILELAENSLKTGEPIVRAVEYEFPDEGFEFVKDMFMLGDKYLVAPVLKKGQFKKIIKLPKGKWKADDENVYEGGNVIEIDTPLERLAYFEKI